MSFSRVHFEYIASVLNHTRDMICRRAGEYSHAIGEFDLGVVPMVADELQAKNPRFNRARFIAACGVKESD